jgi:hypothetical protein
MVGQPCLVSLRAKFHVGGMTWAVFTCVYLESCTWPVAIFTMDKRKEQRVCIKFCANLGKSVTETLEMIQQGFGDQSLSRAQVFQWHARFKTGHVPKMEETEKPGSTLGRELLRGWRRPIGLMASFIIFTASVWKLFDQPSQSHYVFFCSEYWATDYGGSVLAAIWWVPCHPH